MILPARQRSMQSRKQSAQHCLAMGLFTGQNVAFQRFLFFVFLSGAVAFDAGDLESAISSVIFEIIEREKSVSSAASQVSGESFGYYPLLN